MVGNHQTSIYKWFGNGVPGRSLFFFWTCFLIPCENHDDFVNGGKASLVMESTAKVLVLFRGLREASDFWSELIPLKIH